MEKKLLGWKKLLGGKESTGVKINGNFSGGKKLLGATRGKKLLVIK